MNNCCEDPAEFGVDRRRRPCRRRRGQRSVVARTAAVRWLAGRGDSANVTVLARTIPPGHATMISTEYIVAAAFIIRVRVCSFALFPPRRWGELFLCCTRARTRSRKHGVGCWLGAFFFLHGGVRRPHLKALNLIAVRRAIVAV